MPVSPHAITITVNDDAGAALANAKVYVRNCTKKTTSAEATTNGSGVAVIDLANLPLATGQTNQYDSGDVTLIIAYKGNQHDAAKYAVSGSSKAQTLQMNSVPHNPAVSSARLLSLLTANTAGSVAFVKVYAVADGELLAQAQTPANDSRSHSFGLHGKGGGNFVVQREATTLIVTVTTQ